jgi:hypothetical protein
MLILEMDDQSRPITVTVLHSQAEPNENKPNENKPNDIEYVKTKRVDRRQTQIQHLLSLNIAVR